MPIKVPDNLPAIEILRKENIFVMPESRAFGQDIRPLRIALLNLMPLKQITEVQLLRLLGNTPLQIDITLLCMESYEAKNISKEYLTNFYYVFEDVRDEKFDGLIITGAPVEKMDFEQVVYWKELTRIMDWATTNVTSTFYICWGAQAGLYYHYGVPKYPLENKMFGIFPHRKTKEGFCLTRGFDETFYVPHSRHTEIRGEDLRGINELEILSESDDSGIYLVISKNGRQIFVTGHSEYDSDTLKIEYERDIIRGDAIQLPKNYFKDDDPDKEPVNRWRAHSNLLYSNWLNYYVYQETPYSLT